MTRKLRAPPHRLCGAVAHVSRPRLKLWPPSALFSIWYSSAAWRAGSSLFASNPQAWKALVSPRCAMGATGVKRYMVWRQASPQAAMTSVLYTNIAKALDSLNVRLL